MPRFLVTQMMPRPGIGWAHKGTIIEFQDAARELPSNWRRYGEVLPDLTVEAAPGETIDEAIGPFDQDLAVAEDLEVEAEAEADPPDATETPDDPPVDKTASSPRDKMARGGRKKEA